jgi:CDP-glucose 4,6-dehydratase
LKQAMKLFAPEVIFHLAAQPLVRLSYEDPVLTYGTNVMGTVNVLEAVRALPSVRAVVCVTTDKCYSNREWPWGYREDDRLGGHDPYSSSKACAEMVCDAYRKSYFSTSGVALATARAGNVIGGGDWAADRLLPDVLRGFIAGESVFIRNPLAVRPWQHVLEPLRGYINLAESLLSGDEQSASAWNFGPDDRDARPVSYVVEQLASMWPGVTNWTVDPGPHVHEATRLKLDCSKAQDRLNHLPVLSLRRALQLVVEWTCAWRSGTDMREFTLTQIASYREFCATSQQNISFAHGRTQLKLERNA